MSTVANVTENCHLTTKKITELTRKYWLRHVFAAI
jgi:hypothetical protein